MGEQIVTAGLAVILYAVFLTACLALLSWLGTGKK